MAKIDIADPFGRAMEIVHMVLLEMSDEAREQMQVTQEDGSISLEGSRRGVRRTHRAYRAGLVALGTAINSSVVETTNVQPTQIASVVRRDHSGVVREAIRQSLAPQHSK